MTKERHCSYVLPSHAPHVQNLITQTSCVIPELFVLVFYLREKCCHASFQAVSEDGVALGVLEDSHTLSIEVADEAGALQEVTTGFARMAVNVQVRC